MFGMAPSLFKFTFTFFKELLDCMKVKIKVRKDNFIYNREREREIHRQTCIKFFQVSFEKARIHYCSCVVLCLRLGPGSPCRHITVQPSYYCHSSYIQVIQRDSQSGSQTVTVSECQSVLDHVDVVVGLVTSQGQPPLPTTTAGLWS